jgi:hypothetical protein
MRPPFERSAKQIDLGFNARACSINPAVETRRRSERWTDATHPIAGTIEPALRLVCIDPEKLVEKFFQLCWKLRGRPHARRNKGAIQVFPNVRRSRLNFFDARIRHGFEKRT